MPRMHSSLTSFVILLWILCVPTVLCDYHHWNTTSTAANPKANKNAILVVLARYIQKRLLATTTIIDDDTTTIDSIYSALQSISSTQATWKKIDGTAHEMYQRTHKSSTSFEDDDEEDDNNSSSSHISDDDDDDDDDEDDNNEKKMRRRRRNSRGNNASRRQTKRKQLGGLKVAGRMSRNANRVGCIADALFGAELCDLLHGNNYQETENKTEIPYTERLHHHLLDILDEEDGTLAPETGRTILLNTTIYSEDDFDAVDNDDDADDENEKQTKLRLAVSILVIYEKKYVGGVGRKHGGIDDLLLFTKEEVEKEDDDDELNSPQDYNSSPRGRFIVVLSDHFVQTTHNSISSYQPKRNGHELALILSLLDKRPKRLRVRVKHAEQTMNSSPEISATVCESLYYMANKVLDIIRPVLDAEDIDMISNGSTNETQSNKKNGSNIGQGASSVMNDAAIHFVGYSLAGGVAAIAASIIEGALPHSQSVHKKQKLRKPLLSGFGSSRTSALCLGLPPCLSSNLNSDFITSIIHGDDIVCRATHSTINHLCDRARRTMKGGLLGRSIGWVGDAVSLTVSGLKGSRYDHVNNEDASLVVPGKVYLVRPRRIGGGSSSIHEIGGRGSRESLRATLLWQLNDVLVSKSLWTHHGLNAYIRSLDKVRLKGFSNGSASAL